MRASDNLTGSEFSDICDFHIDYGTESFWHKICPFHTHSDATFASHMKKEHAREIIKLDLDFDRSEISNPIILSILSIRQEDHEKMIKLCIDLLKDEPPVEDLLK